MLPDFHDYPDMRSHSGHSGSPLKVKLYALPDSKRVFHNRGPHHRKINQKIRGLFLVSAFKRRRRCFDLSTPLDSADASRRIQDHCGNVGKGLDRKTTDGRTYCITPAGDEALRAVIPVKRLTRLELLELA
jgi:hypothetical protein